MDEKFLTLAIKLAEDNSESGQNGPFGAVVVTLNGNLVGQGWNRVVEMHDPTAHAEITAIRDACSRLKTNVLSDCVLYASCEPCPMCLSAIYWARIVRIVFACNKADATNAGFDDAVIHSEIGKDWNDRSLPYKQMLRENGLCVFEKWIKNSNRIEY